MVKFEIEIEAAVGDPKELNILLKAERNQAAETEETAARRLLPALQKLLKTRFPEGDDAAEKIPSLH
jgi:hypothetical protein